MLLLSAIISEGLPSTVLVPGAELQTPHPVNWAPAWFMDLSSSHRFFQFCMVHFLLSSRWHDMVSEQSLTSYMTHYRSFQRPDSLGPYVHMLVTCQFSLHSVS